MQHRAELGNPRVAAAAATKTPFPSGGAKRHKKPARKGGRQSPPRGAEGANRAQRGGQGGTAAPHPQPGRRPRQSERGRPAASGAPPGQGKGRPEGAKHRSGAQGRPQGARLDPCAKRGAAPTAGGARRAGERPAPGSGRRPAAGAAATAGHGEPDKGRRRNEPHPGERRIPLMPCSRHRAAQGAGRKGALPPKRTDECAPGSRTSPQNDAEQQHGPGVATVAAVLGRRCSPRTAAALAACRRAVGISST